MAIPESQYLVLDFADGTIGVMCFVTRDERAGWERLATAENVEAEIARASESLDPWKLPIKSWRFIDESEIPQDRTYRNALRHTREQGFHHDMAHARELHRQALRAERAPLLAQLDTEYMKAQERGDSSTMKDVAARKQFLRDITAQPAIEAAQTTEELKAAILVEEYA